MNSHYGLKTLEGEDLEGPYTAMTGTRLLNALVWVLILAGSEKLVLPIVV